MIVMIVMNFWKKKGGLLCYKGIKHGIYHPHHCRKHHYLVLHVEKTNMLEGWDGGAER